MARCKKNVTVNYLPRQSFDILRILGIYADVRLILHSARMDFDKGLVLLIEKTERISTFVKMLTDELDAIFVKNLNLKNFKVSNHKIIIHVFNKYDSREVIYQFLENDKFFPVLLVGGVIPEDIGEVAYIIDGESTLITGLSSEHHIQGELRGIEDFVKNNFLIIQHELSLMKTSEKFVNSEHSSSSFWVGLMAAESIFELYFRSSHSEYDTRIETSKICHAINNCILKDRELHEKEDVVDAVKKVVFNYLMNHSDISCGNVDKIEGDLNVKLKNGLAILYDSNFYFVPEALFKAACSSLLQSVSFTEIKRQLKDNGILVCNNTDTTNFTVKKVLVTSYGEKIRDRYLKIRKEFFCTYEGLELKDRREDLCTSEKLEMIQSK
ncbi:MAG: hypothetical protein LUH21_26245 [Clostridiales bacterium]|nr:hypothetical protein [Clostridiales bacterium]